MIAAYIVLIFSWFFINIVFNPFTAHVAYLVTLAVIFVPLGLFHIIMCIKYPPVEVKVIIMKKHKRTLSDPYAVTIFNPDKQVERCIVKRGKIFKSLRVGKTVTLLIEGDIVRKIVSHNDS